MSKKSIKKKFPLSSWFFKRVAIAIVATGGMSLSFLYDGVIGYPKKNEKAQMYQAFKLGEEGKVLANSAAKPEELAAHEFGKSGRSWAEFTAQRNLPSKKPKIYSSQEIRNQFIFAALLGAICLAVIGWTLLMRSRQFLLHDSAFTLPTGECIEFSDVNRIDLKKWDRGFAKVGYRSGDKDCEVKVDDYKFAGVGSIFKNLLKEFPDVEVLGNREWLTKESGSEK